MGPHWWWPVPARQLAKYYRFHASWNLARLWIGFHKLCVIFFSWTRISSFIPFLVRKWNLVISYCYFLTLGVSAAQTWKNQEISPSEMRQRGDTRTSCLIEIFQGIVNIASSGSGFLVDQGFPWVDTFLEDLIVIQCDWTSTVLRLRTEISVLKKICYVINPVGDTLVKHLPSCNTHVIGGGPSSKMNYDC